MHSKTFILCILDGWGYSAVRENNAILNAHTPFFDYIMDHYPWSLLKTSGGAVGLPAGQMGNSEAGHMTIGTGQIIQQDLVRINNSIQQGDFARNAQLNHFIDTLKKSGGTCHLVGLISDGGIHSHIDHILVAALELKKHGIRVVLHAITDGRDVSPRSARKFLSLLQNNEIEIATLSGRYYAMDRDNRWERTQAYYEAITGGIVRGTKFTNPIDILTHNYEQGIDDEFIVPSAHKDYQGIKSGDGLFMLNFRADRVRQLLSSLLDKKFNQFERLSFPAFSASLGIVHYSMELDNLMDSIFSPKKIKTCIGSIIAQQGWKQLRIAETEKYAHVTYFFNGGQDILYPLEDRFLVPSPKVASYDLAPEMSARGVVEKLIEAVASESYKFICVNFANADMVGHTGDFAATIKACEAIDQCLASLYPILKKHDAELLITADHGNAEQMFDAAAKQPLTSHTMNEVPLFYLGKRKLDLRNGGLIDIAPTVLRMMNLEIPNEMEGVSLAIEK